MVQPERSTLTEADRANSAPPMGWDVLQALRIQTTNAIQLSAEEPNLPSMESQHCTVTDPYPPVAVATHQVPQCRFLPSYRQS
jgi:hypothetical protein